MRARFQLPSASACASLLSSHPRRPGRTAANGPGPVLARPVSRLAPFPLAVDRDDLAEKQVIRDPHGPAFPGVECRTRAVNPADPAADLTEPDFLPNAVVVAKIPPGAERAGDIARAQTKGKGECSRHRPDQHTDQDQQHERGDPDLRGGDDPEDGENCDLRDLPERHRYIELV